MARDGDTGPSEPTTPGRATRSRVAIAGTMKELLDSQQKSTPKAKPRVQRSPTKQPPKSPTKVKTPAAKLRATPRSVKAAKYVSESEGDDGEDDELNIVAQEQPKFTATSTPSRNIKHAVPTPSTPSPAKKRKITPPPSARSPLKSPSPSPPSPIIPSKAHEPVRRVPPTPSRIPRVLPKHLHPCLNAQKRAVLRALQTPPEPEVDDEGEEDEFGPPTNTVASGQLTALLEGTVKRGEGNSCMVIGPRGSGKTRLVEYCISALPTAPIVIRLSGWAQHNDRLAMREIAWQLTQQTGGSFLTEKDEEEGEAPTEEVNPFLDIEVEQVAVTLPPPSHLPALISVLPTLARPAVVVLDGFDLFALHARQSLLYCLLDTVQSVRAGGDTKGIIVIGITTRVDTINLLEKRVKSRFSGRMLRTAAPRRPCDWNLLLKSMLCVEAEVLGLRDDLTEEDRLEWAPVWEVTVGIFLDDKKVLEMLAETFSITRDVRMLTRLMIAPILQLTDTSPYLLASALESSIATQRCRVKFPSLYSLSYPEISLLISSVHSSTSGHDVFTFEMLHGTFENQVRASSAPVEIEGGSIGMVRCSRDTLMSAFEHLVTIRVFVCVAAPSASIAKEFVKHRAVVDREEVRKAIEKRGETNLKKWFTKAG